MEKFDHMSGLRIVGIVLAGVGILAAVFPHWFGPLTGGSEPPVDVYEAVERRIRGGMWLGLGLGFIAVTAWRPWSLSIPTVLFYVTLGALMARMLGIVVDGTVSKQWLLVAIEAAIMAGLGFWMWRASASAA